MQDVSLPVEARECRIEPSCRGQGMQDVSLLVKDRECRM